MAGNFNKAFLLGNLTRDPELRHTAQGTAVATFAIAVNRVYKGGDGAMKRDTNYFNIVVWGRNGENCAKYLSKGRSVFVEGRIQNRSYETQDGQKRTATEIVADNVQFLGGSGDRAPMTDDAGDPGFAADFSANDDDVPF